MEAQFVDQGRVGLFQVIDSVEFRDVSHVGTPAFQRTLTLNIKCLVLSLDVVLYRHADGLVVEETVNVDALGFAHELSL